MIKKILIICAFILLTASIAGCLYHTRYSPKTGCMQKIRRVSHFYIKWYKIVPEEYSNNPFGYCVKCHPSSNSLAGYANALKEDGSGFCSQAAGEYRAIISAEVGTKHLKPVCGHPVPFY